MLELVCLHMAGTQPFCYEQRLINLEAVPQVAKETFEDMPPGTWLLHSVPWSLAEHRIRAVEANAETAAALKIRPKSPVLTIERTTRSAESTAITFVRLAYPGELHELVASFAPPTSAGGQRAHRTGRSEAGAVRSLAREPRACPCRLDRADCCRPAAISAS